MNFIDAHDFSVGLVLRVLGIAASTYYGWRKARQQPCQRARTDAGLLVLIDEIRGQSEFAATYGSPRVWLELRRRGVLVSRKRVERIMRVHGRRGAYLRRGWKTGSTRQNPRHTAAPDLLDRDFTATAPNTKWVADLTRILTGEGVLWLASVRDVFSNKVVGWRSGPRADTDLVISALDYAIFSRDVRDGQLIHHSDKGCQYTAVRFTQRLCDAGIAPSTGSVGDSFDNALAENLWSTLKIELIYWPARTFATRAEAEAALFRYIDGWYNPRRIQAGLGGLSPDEYEAAWYARQDPHQAATLQLEGVGPR
ncbi:IS3 family transposase (plasmid) [Mycobacterium avium subsp. hominissuis]|uniref:Integrase n=2 Tax=Mycobacterium TaxID=1763 RepID=A0AA37PYR9_9MYCO|nr:MULTISPECIES: IS3 family transposase [Mycobacterium]MBZ4633038.1 IS3 family transposase [Mycobacterium avium subsp. hominissuis]PBJ34535.1 IS3 family transposase [Mycobacterium avium subsp. hominissuis]QWY65290.1 IS3 family transposase [Mycobacterium avium subsp. hominissuis]QWY65406.1 IS3 family transposase [Mycobacterium avium subsp. hominissuis]QWY65408.1 IS3 family transposase [Mycobacterium avium subsp. hominissuis]